MKLNIQLHGNDESPIVCIDDDDVVLKIISRFYSKSDLKNPLITFNKGQDFIDFLFSIPENDKNKLPAIVFIDINMPIMNGFDVLKKIKENERFNEIPICSMLTSSDHNSDKEEAEKLGANGYLIKPPNPKDYIDFFNGLKKN